MQEDRRERISDDVTPEPVELQRRPLRSEEANRFIEQIRKSTKITGYSKAEWTGDRDTFALVRPHTQETVAAVLVHHLWGNWSELAVGFVLEEYRGFGYGHYALAAAMRTIANDGRNKIAFFTDDRMQEFLESLGFETFDPPSTFVGNSIRRWLFLNVVYKVQWLGNWYRFGELRRKRRDLGGDFSFRVGVIRAQKGSGRKRTGGPGRAGRQTCESDRRRRLVA
jgi:GNAT superfamily N-acetyltransferase